MKSTQVLLLVVGVLTVACMPKNGAEFIAGNDDFANFSKWTFVDKVNGTSENIKDAHLAENPNASRTVYVKNNADRTDNGKFPVGTALVKIYTDKSNKPLGATGMVKRGGGFNKEFGGWEWFVLDANTGKIALDEKGNPTRGAIAMCNQCHAKTAENDYVFTR
jgi:cytochrome c553